MVLNIKFKVNRLRLIMVSVFSVVFGVVMVCWMGSEISYSRMFCIRNI